MIITSKPVLITTEKLKVGFTGQPYSDKVEYVTYLAGNPQFVCENGMPAGLALDGETGVISGTPTQQGNPVVTIRVTVGNGSDIKTF